jgi:predicted dinucleotide-binding enzyme
VGNISTTATTTKTTTTTTTTTTSVFFIMRVVVFGASGVQGAAQVKALTDAGHTAVAISRNPKPLEINGTKVETVALNFDDEQGVADVLKDADVIFVNLPSTFAIPIFIVWSSNADIA